MVVSVEDNKTNLIGYDLGRLKVLASELGEPVFRAKQLYSWIYSKGVNDFHLMSNLNKALRERMAETYSLHRLDILDRQQSSDGTIKWLLGCADGTAIETVFIPEENRGTLCISSQIGCSLTCTFCHTGTQRLVRNLKASEIIAQLMIARDDLDDWDMTKRRITNVVMMGMGEPLFNTDEVIKALNFFTDEQGLSLTKRRVTLSTSGVAPDIPRIGEETGAALAISLHATTDELRNKLVPINRKYPLATLREAILAYPNLSNSRRVTIEYIMIKDVNDGQEDAKRLIAYLKNIPSKINLIPFNPWPGADMEASSAKAMEDFSRPLLKAGYTVTIRRPRGQDILAACGQLRSQSLRLSKREQQALEATRLEKETLVGLA